MDEQFQDRIDNYLLNRMDDAEKTEFLREVEHDSEKRKQLEFTQCVKDSICSREEKLLVLNQFQKQYEEERKVSMRPTKSVWIWLSGIAAVLIGGFLAIKPLVMQEHSPFDDYVPLEQTSEDNHVFSPVPADTTANDTTWIKIEENTDP